MSSFLQTAEAKIKNIQAAQKSRTRLEAAADARFARAQTVYDAAAQARAAELDKARAVEAAAWQDMAQATGLDAATLAKLTDSPVAHVKAMLADAPGS